MEIKISLRILTWLFGGARHPNPGAIRLRDVRKGGKVEVIYLNGKNEIMIFTSQPYLWIKFWKHSSEWSFGWWIQTKSKYKGSKNNPENSQEPLHYMGITKGLRTPWFPHRHTISYRAESERQ